MKTSHLTDETCSSRIANTPRLPQTQKTPRTNQLTNLSGGEEVLLDVGGQDSTEAFEDVGHSDEAREILDGLLVGTVKRLVCTYYPSTHKLNSIPASCTINQPTLGPNQARAISHAPIPQPQISKLTSNQPGDPAPKSAATASADSSASSSTSSFGVGLYAVILLGGALAYGAYNYLQAQQAAQQ
jgi:hypothetical protein